MKAFFSLAASFAALLFPLVSEAQIDIDDIVPDFTPQEQSDIGKAFGTYTSAAVVFTGRNSVSSGTLSYDNDIGDISIINIPFSYTFGEKEDPLRWKMRGAVGHLESRISAYGLYEIAEELRQTDPELFNFPNQPDFRKDSATSLSLGGGIIYEPVEGLEITPSFDFIWTHVKRRFDYNNFISALIGIKYDRELFNNSTESITYSPSLGIAYTWDIGSGYSITPSVLYTHLWSEDLWSKSSFAHFSIDSGILQGELKAEIPLPISGPSGDTELHPFFKASNIHGAAHTSLEEDMVYDVGANIAMKSESEYLSEIRVGLAYITASDFDGYRINLEGDW